jgi:hypothetical protein
MIAIEPGSERPPSEHGYAPLWVVHTLEDLGVGRQVALTLDHETAVRYMLSLITDRLILDGVLEKDYA